MVVPSRSEMNVQREEEKNERRGCHEHIECS